MKFNESIRRKYLFTVLTIGLFLLVSGVTAIYLLDQKQEELREERDYIKKKDDVVNEIEDSLKNVFFRARGYYAFQNEVELSLVYNELYLLKKSVDDIKRFDLTTEEQELMEELEVFVVNFETKALPEAISHVQANDYESLRNQSNNGVNASVNKILSFTIDFHNQANLSRERISDQLIDQSRTLNTLIIYFSLILFFILLSIFYYTLKKMVEPLEKMKKGAEEFGDSGQIQLPELIRKDEIGSLNSSLIMLMKTIRVNEEDLMAQNEELLMQQDELQVRQTKLEASLGNQEIAKNRLEVLNKLNHMLTFSLNRQEVVKLVQEYIHQTFQLDISFLWLEEGLESSSSGMTDELYRRFIEDRYDYIVERLQLENSFSIVREGSIELGLAPEGTLVNDLFHALKDESGQIIAIFCCSRIGRLFSETDIEDIEGLLSRVSLSLERIRLYQDSQYERNLNESIVKTIQEGVFLVGPQGELQQYNQALYDLLSGEREYEKGTPFDTWITLFERFAENKDEIIEFYNQAIREKFTDVRRIQYTFKRKGIKVINLYAACIMTEGYKTGTIFVNRDITKEHEINTLKNELINTVSHELRTPLSSILGFSELLLTNKGANERKEKYVDLIHKESKRLSQLVDDFLDVQRMESGKTDYHLKAVIVEDLLVDLVQNYSFRESHTILIDNLAENTTVLADVERITQVILNLISNAIKFSPDQTEIKISLSQEEDYLKMVVQDYGLGIHPEDIPNLFQKFHRIDNSETRKIGGTGLGLSIVKEIVEYHNGRVWITSTKDVETSVHVLWPLSK
ncbi:MAG: ATP-binding protein [Planococcaceae bacterium]|nr:HAMP domain-containing histidine kinase [Bacillota bacterium]MDX1770169.1 ATP-binding protein [Planococcaceae bacterium]